MMSIVALAFLMTCGPVAACDAGVHWGSKSGLADHSTFSSRPNLSSTWPKHMMKHAPKQANAVDSWPTGANATSWSVKLTWEKLDPPTAGGVFISTTLEVGCGSGYIGGQIWPDENTTMRTDWAIWDIGTRRNTWPIGKHCNRYDGEGFGTQCGLSEKDGYKWTIGTTYTFNVSLLGSWDDGALFGATLTNEDSLEILQMGKIFTERPPPDSVSPQGYDCGRLVVGGGSFQEYFNGGNFTSWATVEGPAFSGVEHHVGDAMPTRFDDCFFHGTCFDNPKEPGCCNCHNETTTSCMPPECNVPRLTFKGGTNVSVPDAIIPPWDKHQPVEPSLACDFQPHTNTNGGTQPEYWGVPLMHDTNATYPCSTEAAKGKCALECCGYCHADPDCLHAVFYNNICAIRHNNPKQPITLVNQSGYFVVTPHRDPQSASPRTRWQFRATPALAGESFV